MLKGTNEHCELFQARWYFLSGVQKIASCLKKLAVFVRHFDVQHIIAHAQKVEP
jgi:hypothetical protein